MENKKQVEFAGLSGVTWAAFRPALAEPAKSRTFTGSYEQNT
jgi:hypothetical protein